MPRQFLDERMTNQSVPPTPFLLDIHAAPSRHKLAADWLGSSTSCLAEGCDVRCHPSQKSHRYSRQTVQLDCSPMRVAFARM